MDQWELDGEREKERRWNKILCVERVNEGNDVDVDDDDDDERSFDGSNEEEQKEKLYNLQQPPLTHPSLSTDQLTPPFPGFVSAQLYSIVPPLPSSLLDLLV